MKKICKTNCNCRECIWDRIIKNSGTLLSLKEGRQVSYKVVNDKIIWSSIEKTQRKLYQQSKVNTLLCIDAREKKLSPSNYPGTATSYKWALFNNENIWKV